jgi:hypothetical protein
VSESSGPNDWNQKIIEEFRANAGYGSAATSRERP